MVYTREIIGTNGERDVRELALKNALADLRCTSGRKTFEMGEFGDMLFHLMPNSAFSKMGFKKADVINLCGTMAELDFSDSLYKVSCPVLIVCGEKDTANKKIQKNFTII